MGSAVRSADININVCDNVNRYMEIHIWINIANKIIVAIRKNVCHNITHNITPKKSPSSQLTKQMIVSQIKQNI